MRTEVEKLIGYRFRDPDLLREALTHRSCANEGGGHGRDNERLEFLGDAVLGLLAGHALFTRHRDSREGELSRMRSAMVDEPALAAIAAELGLGAHLLVGRGAERDGVRDKPSVLASLLEALVAAVYLDGGPRAVRRVFLPHLLGAMPGDGSPAAHRDPKTRLQERLQAAGRPVPVYRLTGETGPDHDRTFTTTALSDGVTLGTGTGRSKKAAEQAAAAAALAELDRAAGD